MISRPSRRGHQGHEHGGRDGRRVAAAAGARSPAPAGLPASAVRRAAGRESAPVSLPCPRGRIIEPHRGADRRAASRRLRLRTRRCSLLRSRAAIRHHDSHVRLLHEARRRRQVVPERRPLLGRGRREIRSPRLPARAVHQFRADLGAQGQRLQPGGHGLHLPHAHHRPGGQAMAERMLHSRKPPRNPFRPEGHIGQVVPLEDAEAILTPLRRRAHHREELHVPLHDPRRQGILLHQLRRDVGDHRQAAPLHPREGEVPPHPGRGDRPLPRAQPQGLHRHHLVRPLPLHQQPLLVREPRVRRHPPAGGFRDQVHLQGRVRHRLQPRTSAWAAARASASAPSAPSRMDSEPRTARRRPGRAATAAASAATSAPPPRCSSSPATRSRLWPASTRTGADGSDGDEHASPSTTRAAATGWASTRGSADCACGPASRRSSCSTRPSGPTEPDPCDPQGLAGHPPVAVALHPLRRVRGRLSAEGHRGAGRTDQASAPARCRRRQRSAGS